MMDKSGRRSTSIEEARREARRGALAAFDKFERINALSRPPNYVAPSLMNGQCGTTEGTSTAYTLATDAAKWGHPWSVAPHDGKAVAFVPHVTNGIMPTLTVDGGNPYPIQTAEGAAIDEKTLVPGTFYEAMFDSAQGAYILKTYFPSDDRELLKRLCSDEYKKEIGSAWLEMGKYWGRTCAADDRRADYEQHLIRSLFEAQHFASNAQKMVEEQLNAANAALKEFQEVRECAARLREFVLANTMQLDGHVIPELMLPAPGSDEFDKAVEIELQHTLAERDALLAKSGLSLSPQQRTQLITDLTISIRQNATGIYETEQLLRYLSRFVERLDDTEHQAKSTVEFELSTLPERLGITRLRHDPRAQRAIFTAEMSEFMLETFGEPLDNVVAALTTVVFKTAVNANQVRHKRKKAPDRSG